MSVPASSIEHWTALQSATTLRELSTPALLVHRPSVEQNIATTISRLGDTAQWRPHVKTARVDWTLRCLRTAGATRAKASTSPEAEAAAEAGIADILLAQQPVGPQRAALAGAAIRWPGVRFSALVEDVRALAGWPAGVGVYLDIDTGMGRSGVRVDALAELATLAAAVREAGVTLRGLHSYDGHLADLAASERDRAVADALRQTIAVAAKLQGAGHTVDEIVAGGTHTLDATVRCWPGGAYLLGVGAGTLVYHDARSLQRCAADPNYQMTGRAAVAVLSRVIAQRGERVTLDAGLSAIQVDAGRPHAVSLAPADLRIERASQEHLVALDPGRRLALGAPVLLLPRHGDTALAQFRQLHLIDADGRLSTHATFRRP